MPELVPLPFAQLVRRMFREFQRENKIFDLPANKFWRGAEAAELNTGVRFHGYPAATPLGPAAGPHTQMAQNIVLSWLGGCRVMELKTVQIDDRLSIGRPCIDATNVGYNIEFSQELLLGQSLDEYVKAWMLLRMLEQEETLGVPKRARATAHHELPNFYDCIFDLSCGYNLEGIRSEKVQTFIHGLLDASSVIDRLRAEIPDEFAHLRSIEYDPRIVNTATLSTFHGCPADEIERIVEFLLRENHLHTIIKMNPTMLGGERLDEILHNILGYPEMQLNPAALTSGLQFDDSIVITRRLRRLAHSLGLRVGAKFNNTLEVMNHRDFFQPSEKVMYMSGAPLHPIAVELAYKFRSAYLSHVNGLTTDEREPQEDGYVPISFSAGVDKMNFAPCVACGFVPITTCTDLLKPGGFGRTIDYVRALETDMRRVSAFSIDQYIMNYSGNDAGEVATQTGELLANQGMYNHERIAREVVADTRYSRTRNAVIPKRINSFLTVFDCITCDKCIPVCPNDANFTYQSPETDITYRNYLLKNGQIVAIDGEHQLQLKKSRQIANFAAFCNECGNCDTFCPEYGGPFIQKPTFFSDFKEWDSFEKYDGFYIEVREDAEIIYGRMHGQEYILRVPNTTDKELHEFTTALGTFPVNPENVEPLPPLEPLEAAGPIDMKVYLTLRILLEGVLHDERVNYVNA
ncbi:MAG: glutamate synthase [Candidatus Sumerlaeaceae bacterium]